MIPEFKSDVFDQPVNLTLEEAKGEVDGKNIIGKVSGTFFVPNGKSRNKRFYPESLWRKALSDKNIQERLANRQMLGTIGHDQPLDDDAVKEGKVSHVVTKLEIKEGKGYGEALILGTPAGQILKTMTGAGVRMYTSSRATGGYKGEYEGLPVVDENRYNLKGFDFVLDPGFLEANPSLVEELKESIDTLINLERNVSEKVTSNTKEKEEMKDNKELLEQLVVENRSLKSDVQDALKENETVKASLGDAEETIELLKDKLKKYEGKDVSVDQYEKLGSPTEIEEKISKLEEQVAAFDEIGSVEEIQTAFKDGLALVREYKEIGTPEEITQALTVARDRIREYKELGTPDEIKEAFRLIREVNKKRKEEQNTLKAEELAKELSVSVESVKKVYGKMDDDEIREFFKDISESSRYGTKYRKTKKVEESNGKDEDVKERYFDKPVGRRLMESFNA